MQNDPVPRGPLPFTLELSLQAHDFQSEWKRCNMLANYVAEYAAYQFVQRERAENLISTVLNELLEAVVHLAPGDSPFSVRCTQLEGEVRLDVEHTVRAEMMQRYQVLLQDLDRGVDDALYLELLTLSEKDHFNQLGLTMLVHDFGARIATHPAHGAGRLCTQVSVSAQELLP